LKASQAYDSAAQGAAQATDYAQVSVCPVVIVVVPRPSILLQQACFAVMTPDMWPASQTKAGQAYDSAAQGAAQAKDYTQVKLLVS